MASAALFGFSRMPHDNSFPAPQSDVTGSYVTDILPFILLMSFGMGMTFVPLTLSAVHHLRSQDSGIGSGVLNTMQQVGGALGLAVLGTVATQVINDRTDEFASASQAAASAPGAPQPNADQVEAMQQIVGHQIFADGATTAFLVGAVMMLGASIVVWLFLNVKHTELATDGPEGVLVA